MKFQENYKIALTLYKFGGSVFERIINKGVGTLKLEDLTILPDDEAGYFGIPVKHREHLLREADFIQAEFLDDLAVKYCERLKAIAPAHKELTGEVLDANKITLTELSRPHSAVMVYKQDSDGVFIPYRMLLWYIIEVVTPYDALQSEIAEKFPYKEDAEEDTKEDTENEI